MGSTTKITASKVRINGRVLLGGGTPITSENVLPGVGKVLRSEGCDEMAVWAWAAARASCSARARTSSIRRRASSTSRAKRSASSSARPSPCFFVPPLFGPARELLQLRVGRPRPHPRADLLLPGPASDSLLLSLTSVLLPRRASAPHRPPRVCARPLRLFVALLLEPAWMPALLRLAFARLQPQRAAAPLPVRRVCWQPLRLAREPFPRGRAPLLTRGPDGPPSPQRLCGRLLPWRVVGLLFPLAGVLPQRGVVLPRLRAPNDWPLPMPVAFLLLPACGLRLRPTAGPLSLQRIFVRLPPELLIELLLLRACGRLPPRPA